MGVTRMVRETSAEKFRRLHAKRKASGLRAVTVWIPDNTQDRALIQLHATRLRERHAREAAGRSAQRASKMQACASLGEDPNDQE